MKSSSVCKPKSEEVVSMMPFSKYFLSAIFFSMRIKRLAETRRVSLSARVLLQKGLFVR